MAEQTLLERSISTFASVLVMGSLVVGASFWISTRVASLSMVVETHAKAIDELMKFKTVGDRFTSKQGAKLEARIERLEDWTQRAPPQWFRELFSEFKADMNEEVKVLNRQFVSLKIEVLALSRILAEERKERSGRLERNQQ